MEERRHHDEEMSMQIQSAIAPLTAMIYEMRKDIKTLREDNEAFRNLIIGARFTAALGKALLMFFGLVGMIYGAFLVITHK